MNLRKSTHTDEVMSATIHFSYICLTCLTVCVGVTSVEPVISVSARVGSTAILPCKLRVDSHRLYIRWRIKTETVFERIGSETYEGEGYKDRVDVPVDELRKGNCSLVVHNLKLTDAAVYTSFQFVRRSKRDIVLTEKNHVKLSVYDPTDQRSHDLTDQRSPDPTGDTGVKYPHTLITVLSMVLTLLVQLFYKAV